MRRKKLEYDFDKRLSVNQVEMKDDTKLGDPNKVARNPIPDRTPNAANDDGGG